MRGDEVIAPEGSGSDGLLAFPPPPPPPNGKHCKCLTENCCNKVLDDDPAAALEGPALHRGPKGDVGPRVNLARVTF